MLPLLILIALGNLRFWGRGKHYSIVTQKTRISSSAKNYGKRTLDVRAGVGSVW